ncbi:hypothetical protein ACMDCR_09165 [Labrys okinawensis]|uniref:hypothetical protein n=1 Tax=Labrys okinawensis TaxID=346911 RepID=UPI0039BD88CB
MTIVYGSCVEPGGMELDDTTSCDRCPSCDGPRCKFQYFEYASCGSINLHHSIICEDCGYRDLDLPDALVCDDDFDPDDAE